MPYFNFNFREQVFQAQYEIVAGSQPVSYRITDLPGDFQTSSHQEIVLQFIDEKIIKPGEELQDAIADGLDQTLKGIHHF
jgi:hypothetical protein